MIELLGARSKGDDRERLNNGSHGPHTLSSSVCGWGGIQLSNSAESVREAVPAALACS